MPKTVIDTALPEVRVEDFSGFSCSSEELDSLLLFDGKEFIERCYILFLGRDADEAGVQYYLEQLQLDGDKEKIARLIHTSSEAVSYRSRIATGNDPGAFAPMVVLSRGVAAKSLSEAVGNGPTIWFDLTTSFEWTGGVVGIIRAELELAVGLKKLNPGLRFSMQIENGFAEIPETEISWLLNAENIIDSYLYFFGRHKAKPSKARVINVSTPEKSGFFHPYGKNDTILSVGWMDSKKEGFFTRLKSREPAIKLGYLIYDIILVLPQTRHFYDQGGGQRFHNYIRWISYNADFILYGGETAKKDTEAYQKQHGWPLRPGRAVKFGSDIIKNIDENSIPQLLAEVGVTGRFIMTVGSMEPRKNHDTLYRAYLLVREAMGEAAPQLVIVGKPMWRVEDLLSKIKRDPRVAGKVILVTPSDAQLAALYARCEFTLLPSVYEGWSLTLPESLGQGKFCLACETPPLREIGGDLVDYVEAFDVRAWADKIIAYCKNLNLLRAREQRIQKRWPVLRWIDTAAMVRDAIQDLTSPLPNQMTVVEAAKTPTIWMDLTLTFLQWAGGLNGIVRTELTYAYHLKKLAPSTRFFAWDRPGDFFEVTEGYLSWLLNSEDLAICYKSFHDFWRPAEEAGGNFRNPLRALGRHAALSEAYLASFPNDSIVFFAGIDSDGSGRLWRNRQVLDLINPRGRIMTSQLLYDMTPILVPHLHAEPTCVGYVPFMSFVSNKFDHLIYGGKTAMRDGIAYQRSQGLRTPPSDYIEFGSNVKLNDSIVSEPQPGDADLIARLGVSSDFIMTVGTLEPRKNHELLYKAYLRLVERYGSNLPQMLFIGRTGWNSDDFLETLRADKRVEGRILIVHPNDAELAALYRLCKFTLLPSFYEGWSLTLPESLSYGKFCLTSDVDPLKETGRDLVEYLNPLDTFQWADRIEYYIRTPEELKKREGRIRSHWKPLSWVQSTERLIDILHSAHGRYVSDRNSGGQL